MQHLSIDDVIHIHERVCRDFADSEDPVDTPGVRDRGLLESAVHRQYTGWGFTSKYADPHSNAATLTFGLCNDHPFYNGNKRTALISMIAHLDANGYALFGVSHKELYRMIKEVAKHSLGVVPPSREVPREQPRRAADDEVEAIRAWLLKNTRKLDKPERRITYRDLRKKLESFGFKLDNPKGNVIAVYRRVRRRNLLLQKQEQWKRIGSIPFPGDGKMVSRRDMKYVRELCGLDHKHGYDSRVFYEGADPVDRWINDYRSVLVKLSAE